MITKVEYEGYRSILEGKDLRRIMTGHNPDEISKTGSEMAVYYARISGEFADIKDASNILFLQLVKSKAEGGEGMSAARANKEAEVAINSLHEVTRRQLEYMMAGMDKISFACSARVKSFNKEGNF